MLATFAHEMNGDWDPWGYGGSEHTTPAQWIAAWDHVVTVINAQAPGRRPASPPAQRPA